ncbi:bifunctional apoptosis regulator [Tachyglossus aculeatus]|uniref:bifunctional apoptosis regulator n=1 Tax=Tachyglossus aculeatus TaxID=9261 RepID=UPI0018F6F306|nr:bifunctional apoptosis regulator [Tachyglossus aculeatus]
MNERTGYTAAAASNARDPDRGARARAPERSAGSPLVRRRQPRGRRASLASVGGPKVGGQEGAPLYGRRGAGAGAAPLASGTPGSAAPRRAGRRAPRRKGGARRAGGIRTLGCAWPRRFDYAFKDADSTDINLYGSQKARKMEDAPIRCESNMMSHEEEEPDTDISGQISVNEFSCHCCYDILVNPTTLNCGHSFCRHCLALWWVSSKKTECPECREKWEGFPKVNILLRDAIEKLFPDAIKQRIEDIQQNSDVVHSLAAFQKYGNNQISVAPNSGRANQQRGGGFFSGVLTALTGVAVVLLVYHWSSRESEHDLLVHKSVAKWTAEEVILWLEQLGPWASLYKEKFLSERVNGRLLLTLTDEEFSKIPYSIENSSHRKAILMELERVKALGVKPPQNLWEYKAVNPGKSLFLLYALKSSPRLSMLYLYLFDYADTFLPFIHTICPEDLEEDILTKLLDLKDPSWKQWREFLVKYSFLPYQLIAEFAWDWLEVHYWTSRFLIVNAMLLSVLELFSFWRIWSRSEMKTVPHRMWSHFWKVSTQGLFVAIFWPVIPQFVCNCLFYWALYFNPIINIDLVVKEVRRLETQVL